MNGNFAARQSIVDLFDDLGRPKNEKTIEVFGVSLDSLALSYFEDGPLIIIILCVFSIGIFHKNRCKNEDFQKKKVLFQPRFGIRPRSDIFK